MFLCELAADQVQSLITEMHKAASVASALVLFFSTNCANFWPVYAQNWLNLYAVLC